MTIMNDTIELLTQAFYTFGGFHFLKPLTFIGDYAIIVKY